MKSRYTGLWLLLALGMALVIAVSFMDDITIGSWTVKKAPYKDMLLATHDSLSETDPQVLRDSLEARENKADVAEVDSTSQSILLIGDSMTLNLAYRLSRYAKANGHEFHAVNWDSSNTRIWAESDTLQHFIRQYDATYVFISLGSNELYLTKPEGHRKYVEAILAKLGGRPYVWIGPPNWKEDAGINDMIQSACEPRAFFRSAGMTFERKKDKIHPTRAASALWIDSVARWITKSAHPILLDIPSDSIGKVNPNVTFLKARNK